MLHRLDLLGSNGNCRDRFWGWASLSNNHWRVVRDTQHLAHADEHLKLISTFWTTPVLGLPPWQNQLSNLLETQGYIDKIKVSYVSFCCMSEHAICFDVFEPGSRFTLEVADTANWMSLPCSFKTNTSMHAYALFQNDECVEPSRLMNVPRRPKCLWDQLIGYGCSNILRNSLDLWKCEGERSFSRNSRHPQQSLIFFMLQSDA